MLFHVWHMCRCIHSCMCMQRLELDIRCLPLLFSVLLLWDRVSHWTRSTSFQLGWLARSISGVTHLCATHKCWGYKHTLPCLTFLQGCWGLPLRSMSLQSKHSHPLSHLPSTLSLNQNQSLLEMWNLAHRLKNGRFKDWVCYVKLALIIYWFHIWRLKCNWESTVFLLIMYRPCFLVIILLKNIV